MSETEDSMERGRGEENEEKEEEGVSADSIQEEREGVVEGDGGAGEGRAGVVEKEEAARKGKEGAGEEGVRNKHKEMCREMFQKVTEYLNGELAATSEEYELLHRLNQMTLAKYQDMATLASRLNEVSQRLNDKFIALQPYCDQIDQVEASVSALEQTAYRLDAYCKRLEGKFRDLERR